jgi:hypothetical protein
MQSAFATCTPGTPTVVTLEEGIAFIDTLPDGMFELPKPGAERGAEVVVPLDPH